MSGGGDRRYSIWAPVDPNGDAVKRAEADGGFYSDVVGHTVSGDFAEWYAAHEGAFYLGAPLSQVYKEAATSIQYFECGALIRRDGTVKLAPLGARGAQALGVDLSPIDQGDLPEFSESLFKTAENPDPVGDISAPGRKWVEVNISQERLWAYQGDTVVMTTLVSTGLAPNHTERGTFHIWMKFEKQTMSGFTGGTGEVVSLGDTPVAGGTHYEVKDVPNVMYVNTDAEALHGAYWHNNFGQPMSHGCINLPLDVAAWMYGWTPLGTMVWVHD
ncbi:MAG: L,D-transpeptidase [Thermomicrobiales bacterium]